MKRILEEYLPADMDVDRFTKIDFDFPRYDLAYLDSTAFPLRFTLETFARFIAHEMRETSVAACTFTLAPCPVDTRERVREDLRHLTGRPDLTSRNVANAIRKLIAKPVKIFDAKPYETNATMGFFTIVQQPAEPSFTV